MIFDNIELAKHPNDPEIKKGFMGSHIPQKEGYNHSIGIGIGQFQTGFPGYVAGNSIIIERGNWLDTAVSSRSTVLQERVFQVQRYYN